MENIHKSYQPHELLCGIDGGGTTTRVLVARLDGQIVDRFQTGTTNHYGAGLNKARENFASIASHLKENFGCLPAIIFNGNSALDGPADADQVQYLTQHVFEPARVIFHADVFIALLGFTLGEPGAMLIAGTGSMACGLDAKGVYHTAGGWGQVLGDEGSAYHLALEGIKAGLRAYDGVGAPTQLTHRIMQHFNLGQLSELIDLVYNPPMEKGLIAAFAAEVEAAALEGDQMALLILEEEAAWLYKLALAISRKCGTTNLGFYGGVLNHNDRIRTQLAKLLAQSGILLQEPKLSPVVGALIGAFREAGVPLSEAILRNLSNHK